MLRPVVRPDATLLFGESGETRRRAAPRTGWRHRPERSSPSAGRDAGGNTGESIGCRYVDGGIEIVTYRYTFVGGDRLDNSTAMDVEVLSLDGAPLDSFTLDPPRSERGWRSMIVEPHCNGLPVFTEG